VQTAKKAPTFFANLEMLYAMLSNAPVSASVSPARAHSRSQQLFCTLSRLRTKHSQPRLTKHTQRTKHPWPCRVLLSTRNARSIRGLVFRCCLGHTAVHSGFALCEAHANARSARGLVLRYCLGHTAVPSVFALYEAHGTAQSDRVRASLLQMHIAAHSSLSLSHSAVLLRLRCLRHSSTR